MRHSILFLASLASLSTTASAQLIAARQQSVDTDAPLPVAIDGERMALQQATLVRVNGEWLPSEPLIGTTLAVAADAGRFVTGNPLRNSGGNFQSGVARVQSRVAAGWTVDATLLPSDLRERLAFGTEVAISDDTVAVLAPGWRPVGQPPQDGVGAVYVFRETAAGWIEEALLTPAAGEVFHESILGGRIALDGDTLVVAGRATVPGTPSTAPAVHVLQRSAGGWSEVTRFAFPNLPPGGGFYLDVQEDLPGTSASIAVRAEFLSRIYTGHGATWQGSDIAVGTTGPAAFAGSVLAIADRSDGVAGAGTAGSVHLYQRDAAGTWLHRRRVVSSNPQPFHRFGEHLDLDGEWLAVGSRGEGTTFPLDLAVDLFRIVTVGPAEYCTGFASSKGEVTRIASSGSTSVAANDLELVAGPVPSTPGLFYYGTTRLQIPFGDGLRCVGGGAAGVHRLPQGAGTNGLLTHRLDVTSPPTPAGQILPGSTWNFQAWFRDPAAGGAGFNLSTGLELSFTP